MVPTPLPIREVTFDQKRLTLSLSANKVPTERFSIQERGSGCQEALPRCAGQPDRPIQTNDTTQSSAPSFDFRRCLAGGQQRSGYILRRQQRDSRRLATQIDVCCVQTDA